MTELDARPPISAYIRTLDEERMIAEVVHAALQVAREVIVIDCGSEDRTVELARGAGAKVIEHTWAGNGHQKRIAEDACANHWLLDIDADEIVTPALAAEIKALFAHGEPPYRVYRTMMALHPPVGRPWLDFALQTRHKLYDRRVIRIPAHDAWDQFVIPEGLEVGVFNAPIMHYAFSGAAQFNGKINRNSSVRAEKLPLKSRPYLALRIILGLPIYFAKKYFLQQYFRGGVYGFALALMSGYGRWLKDVKMWERANRNRNVAGQ